MIEWIFFGVGFAIGFVSAILSLIIYGRKQIAQALKELKPGDN